MLEPLCHLVTEDLDDGPILGQALFPVTTNDESLIFNNVFRSGAITLASVLFNWGDKLAFTPSKHDIITVNPELLIKPEILEGIFKELK